MYSVCRRKRSSGQELFGQLIEKVKPLLYKYQDILLYGIFGVLTTLVNIVSYWLMAHPLKMGVMASTMLAWVFSVCFAYVTNRKWVFRSKASGTKAVVKELVSFFACRIATGVVDWACMFLFVEVLRFNDVVIKVLANILVIILNYIASKLLVFRQK